MTSEVIATQLVDRVELLTAIDQASASRRQAGEPTSKLPLLSLQCHPLTILAGIAATLQSLQSPR